MGTDVQDVVVTNGPWEWCTRECGAFGGTRSQRLWNMDMVVAEDHQGPRISNFVRRDVVAKEKDGAGERKGVECVFSKRSLGCAGTICSHRGHGGGKGGWWW